MSKANCPRSAPTRNCTRAGSTARSRIILAKSKEKIAFAHIDCDLYESTKTIFSLIAERIQPGTVLVFDEYFNYPSWRDHEFKAFQEFVAGNNVRYSYLSYAKYNVCVRIEAIGKQEKRT